MFKIIKGFLGLIFIFTVVAAGLYTAAVRGLLPDETSQKIKTTIVTWLGEGSQLAQNIQTEGSNAIQALPPSAQQQITALAERSQQSQQVLGSFIEVNQAPSEQQLHERALEYGQYLYCKQAVEAWEQQAAAANSNIEANQNETIN